MTKVESFLRKYHWNEHMSTNHDSEGVNNNLFISAGKLINKCVCGLDFSHYYQWGYVGGQVCSESVGLLTQ